MISELICGSIGESVESSNGSDISTLFNACFLEKYFELDFDRQSACGSSKTALVQFWFGQTGLDIINIDRLQNKESSIYIYEAKSSFFI